MHWDLTKMYSGFDDAKLAADFAQAQALGLPGIGKLEPGYQADIVLLTREFKVSKTLVDGEIRYEA